jgi:prepilin-type N-terminal cleavage/methylation domain-containing protein
VRIDSPATAYGFTIVEVLVALVVLCFGLLALEALSVVVARGITRAERESEWALAAGARAEQALDSLRTGCLGAHPLAIVELRGAASGRDTLLREITEAEGLYTVQLAMRPARGDGRARPGTFTLRADAFLPDRPACAP